MGQEKWPELQPEVRDIWNDNAAFWDDYMGEGNDFHRILIAPATERLLDLREGEVVLEIACGNGSFARRMAGMGAQVVATDFSETFIERARAKSAEYAGRIEYRVLDAADSEQLLALGVGCYDAAVCNMALMDMADIGPLAQALPQLLKPGGRFVFSVCHPCFNSVGTTKIAEEEDREGELVARYAVAVWRYITPRAAKGLGVIGQPRPQYYFHRPLSVLLGEFFRAGLVLDGLEEPTFEGGQGKRAFSWENFPEIPPALVVRMRVGSWPGG